jgi:hypothetical protein
MFPEQYYSIFKCKTINANSNKTDVIENLLLTVVSIKSHDLEASRIEEMCPVLSSKAIVIVTRDHHPDTESQMQHNPNKRKFFRGD